MNFDVFKQGRRGGDAGCLTCVALGPGMGEDAGGCP